jgi:predicted DNA-binding transcriptional regulator AlpA
MDVILMTRMEVCKALATSSAGLHRGMKDGRFPKPYRTGLSSVRWKSNEVHDVINNLSIAVPVEVAPGSKRGRKAKNREEVTNG